MDYKINRAEHEALYSLPHLQQLLYFRGIRPYMDFKTGVVGIKRKVSYQSLREECYVAAHPGYTATAFSRDQIRRAILSLQKAGVITIQSKDRHLILKCLLATQDNCVQNKAATNPPYQAATVEKAKQPENIEHFQQLSQKAARDKSTKAATPPVSGNNNTLSLAETDLKIDAEFKPSTEILAKAKAQQCLSIHGEDELQRFIAYHQSKQTDSYNWDAEYLRWLLMGKRYQTQGDHNGKQHKSYQATPSLSAVERVKRACQQQQSTGYLIEHVNDYSERY